MNFDEAQALEILIHDRYADVLELQGIWRSGTGSHFVYCRERQTGNYVRFYDEHDLWSDYGERAGDV